MYSEDRLEGIITPDGIFRDATKATGRFNDRIVWEIFGTTVFRDSSGVYQVDFDEFSIRQIAEGEFDRINYVTPSSVSSPTTAWATVGDQLIRFGLQPIDSSKDAPKAKSVIPGLQNQNVPLIKFVKQATYEFEPAKIWETVHVIHAPDDTWVLVKHTSSEPVRYRNLDKSKRGEFAEATLPVHELDPDNSYWGALCAPPCLVGAQLALTFSNSLEIRSGVDLYLVVATAHMIVAAVLCWILATVLRLKSRSRLVWTIVGGLLGIGTLLALIAIYPKPILEACPKCDKNRRIDFDHCGHCGNAWDLPMDEGIEIIEPIENAEPMMV